MTEEGFPFILPPEDEEPSAEGITFQVESTNFELADPESTIDWIASVIQRENCRLLVLNYVFCSDDYLHRINLEYLDHDTLTDIITFPYADPPVIHGDIFISIDRIRDNADSLQTEFTDELHRVMIHGVLHLCGYGDKSPAEKKLMTQKEDEALSLIR
ncbi:rRNA maturation RNase YbeY [Flavilitoribacter nigricans]|uniref:Endoribonuclease YbeY n=1 Tax=Flavilitoribacter nigricans (strain ATCC 23147 / DSM 23189 / NBRC 102662 / NCIMB 1420 / SS-2) TaxID=1122177 RepID=A0A2D0N5L5_FLAN2|nr:rRNA maturation RNase YbeY [Flavilitoribacter nigricans]PHN03688.1 rRNA maturation RNase YbeY [Flavilitoribacter nigricans DSM 23189 = NBRC 102662]